VDDRARSMARSGEHDRRCRVRIMSGTWQMFEYEELSAVIAREDERTFVDIGSKLCTLRSPCRARHYSQSSAIIYKENSGKRTFLRYPGFCSGRSVERRLSMLERKDRIRCVQILCTVCYSIILIRLRRTCARYSSPFTIRPFLSLPSSPSLFILLVFYRKRRKEFTEPCLA